MTKQADKPRPKFPPKHGFDHELRRAREEGKTVTVCLATETSFTDEDFCFSGTVEWVDTFSVKFKVGDDTHWVSKSFIVSVTL